MTRSPPTDGASRESREGAAAVCPVCGIRTRVKSPNEAIAFYRRHRSVTGHDVEWDRVGDLERPPSDDLRTLIGELQDRFPNGVPVGVVTAATSEHGRTIGETVAGVRELRMSGKLYEPRDDRLRVV